MPARSYSHQGHFFEPHFPSLVFHRNIRMPLISRGGLHHPGAWHTLVPSTCFRLVKHTISPSGQRAHLLMLMILFILPNLQFWVGFH